MSAASNSPSGTMALPMTSWVVSGLASVLVSAIDWRITVRASCFPLKLGEALIQQYTLVYFIPPSLYASANVEISDVPHCSFNFAVNGHKNCSVHHSKGRELFSSLGVYRSCPTSVHVGIINKILKILIKRTEVE
jgi:hypothetical protein